MVSSSQSSEQQESKQPQQTSQQDPNTSGRNPITQDELNKKLQEIKNDKEKSKRFQEQLDIKYRTEMQNFKYTPPEEFKDHPNLQPTDVDLGLSQSPSQPNKQLGEVLVTQKQSEVIEQAQQTPKQQPPTVVTPKQEEGVITVEQAQQAASSQDKPSESIKG